MTKNLQGTGLGDGQADQATTNDLESEDIFEGAEKPKRPDEEDEEKPEEQEEKTKEEDGVEMSGDLDAQMQVGKCFGAKMVLDVFFIELLVLTP